MIEQRKLTQSEVDQLIREASDEEAGWIREIGRKLNKTSYEVFTKYSIDWDGVVVDGRPIYIAGIFKNGDRHELWTVVNTDVKEQIALFKCAKRGLIRWIKGIPNIYATMKKSWVKNIEWTKRLGFKVFSDTTDTITFVMKREK
jgi:hypothetical protein